MQSHCTAIARIEAANQFHTSNRQRTEEEADDAQLEALQAEVIRLRGVNQLLQKSCVCIQEKVNTPRAAVFVNS